VGIMGKSRFRTFDIFQKTVEEARIRTASGGLVTLVSGAIIFWLVVLEVWDWRRIVVRNELVVDSTRGSNLLSLPFVPPTLHHLGLGAAADRRRTIANSFEYYLSASAMFK